MKAKRNYLSKTVLKAFSLVLLFQTCNTAHAMIWCQWGGGANSCGYVAGSCAEWDLHQGISVEEDGMTTFCFSLANASDVNILVDPHNNAVLEVDGEVVNVFSDKIEHLLKEVLVNKELDKEKFTKEFNELNKLDDGFVSDERLKKIAHKHNIEIIKVDKLPQVNFKPSCKGLTKKSEHK